MLGYHQPAIQPRRPTPAAAGTTKLIGYVLSAMKHYEPGNEELLRLDDKCANSGFELSGSESDVGISGNPMRMGLWRVLRKLTCSYCEPKKMPFSLINFDDFLQQALLPCVCRNSQGRFGIVVQKLDHITNDRNKLNALILELARRGKHVVAEDNICLSCCHPATRDLLNGQ